MKCFLILAACIAGAAALAAPNRDTAFPKDPLPSLVALAAERKIPISGFDTPRSERSVNKGDTLVVLFSLLEKGRKSQWLLQAVSAKDSGSQNEPVILQLSITGPFCTDLNGREIVRDVKEVKTSISANRALLSYGLGDWCEE